MRNLILLMVLFFTSCSMPFTNCEDTIPDGYDIKYSPIRNKYSVCHVVLHTSINMDYDGVITHDTTYETTWIGYNVSHNFSFRDNHKNAYFNNFCGAKKALLEALDTDDITTDFK